MAIFESISTTEKAKSIIRSEIRHYDWNVSTLKEQVDHDLSHNRLLNNNPYLAGKKLVEGGSFACYFRQTDKMLGKVYGKKKVDTWTSKKKWEVYQHLIAREIKDIYQTGRMNLTNKKN